MRIEDVEAAANEIRPQVTAIAQEVSKVLVGQHEMVRRLLIGRLANGHLLLEGVPGLAKTTAVKAK